MSPQLKVFPAEDYTDPLDQDGRSLEFCDPELTRIDRWILSWTHGLWWRVLFGRVLHLHRLGVLTSAQTNALLALIDPAEAHQLY